jgi:hypothetical protein
MGLTFREEENNVMVMRVTGLLKKAELNAVQAVAVKRFSPNTKVKVMIVEVNFQGWERGADWGDMSFYAKYGDKIAKIAIVGDPKWETDLKMFLGSGFRAAPVKFFPSNQIEDARMWLAE